MIKSTKTNINLMYDAYAKTKNNEIHDNEPNYLNLLINLDYL